jgi:hypothetical protein
MGFILMVIQNKTLRKTFLIVNWNQLLFAYIKLFNLSFWNEINLIRTGR